MQKKISSFSSLPPHFPHLQGNNQSRDLLQLDLLSYPDFVDHLVKEIKHLHNNPDLKN